MKKMMFILFIVTMLVSSVKVKAESSEITNLLEQFYDLNNGELPFAMTEEELRCAVWTRHPAVVPEDTHSFLF